MLSDLEPDEAGLVLPDGAALSLDVEDPELATGEPGSDISRGQVVGRESQLGPKHSRPEPGARPPWSGGTVEINIDLTDGMGGPQATGAANGDRGGAGRCHAA